MQDHIYVKGARENNLKNVDVTIPRDKLVVLTGLSGSGKSSLAFDTIYAEGQRRYVESLSSYARMFLGQMDKPDLDSIDGLSPAVSIDQKTTSKNPRSTVGTVTEIYDYLRLMYARIGVPHCPICGREITQQTVDEMVDEVMKLPERTRFQVLAPVVRARKGTQAKELDAARRAGFARVRVDGNMYDLSEEINLEKNIKHTVEIVVDRLVINDTVRGRLADSIETALAQANGLVVIDVIGGEPMMFSQSYACPEHGISISDLSPRLFSFNNPLGACEKCTGLGTFMRVDEERILPNRDLSIREGAVKASGWYYAEGSVAEMYYLGLGKKYGFTLDTPIKEMSTEAVNALLYGTNEEKIEMHRTNEFGSGVYYNTFEGIVENLAGKQGWVNLAPGIEHAANRIERSGEAPADRIEIRSVRKGAVPGIHTVTYESEDDVLEIRHTIKNRRTLALGAVVAAEFLCGKQGVYSMDDLLRNA